MLYIFQGTNIPKSNEKAHSLIVSLRTKKPDASFARIDADNWKREEVLDHTQAQGLFSSKYIIFLDRVSENENAGQDLLELLPAMKSSENIFIILEGKVPAELNRALEKNADKVVHSNVELGKETTKKKDFSIFALGDALGNRDSFKAWSLYRQAVENGFEPENILGTLFWQVKSIILAERSETAPRAGLNPFVYSNCKRFAKKYRKGELDRLLNQIIVLYHDGHRGLLDVELATERLLLNCAK